MTDTDLQELYNSNLYFANLTDRLTALNKGVSKLDCMHEAYRLWVEETD